MITSESIADVEFSLSWKSPEAHHTEILFRRINFWRDIMPGDLYADFMGDSKGKKISRCYRAGEFLPVYNQHGEMKVRRHQLDERRAKLRTGRFYPKGILRGMAGIFPENIEPFRCVHIDDDLIHADFNHPMAGRDICLMAEVSDITPKANTLGGECVVLSEVLTSGPGMQTRWKEKPTIFLNNPDEFRRDDEEDDSVFYRKPRFVMHIDSLASSNLSKALSRYLRNGFDVLDLMASWRSHLPHDFIPGSVTGLGMNMDEMNDNPVLKDKLVHDLNADPGLPFGDESFDVVLCSMSVEYLTKPHEVFSEVARVLKPGGVFAVSFSNRWFPPKAIKIWSELHDFEKMGLVLDYFMGNGSFKNLETISYRGYPRPFDDKYFPSMRISDPLYVVSGKKIEE